MWNTAYIHSRAGKATGKYANCVNIQLEGDENVQCVDWTEVADEWQEVAEGELEEEQEVLLSSVAVYDQDVVDEKLAELNKFKDNNVYEEVNNQGQSTIGVR